MNLSSQLVWSPLTATENSTWKWRSCNTVCDLVMLGVPWPVEEACYVYNGGLIANSALWKEFLRCAKLKKKLMEFNQANLGSLRV